MSAGGGGWVGGYEGYNMSGRKRAGTLMLNPRGKLGTNYLGDRVVTSFRRRGGSRGSFAAKYAGRGSRPGPSMYRKFRGLRRYVQSGIETKFLDTNIGITALVAPPANTAWAGLDTLNPAALAFNCPVQGTGASNREGRKITMESLQIEGLVRVAPQVDQAAADERPVVKIWIVLDKQTNGGTATGLDSENVYTNPGAVAIGGLAPLRNMLYTKRYKVLKEIEVSMQDLPIPAFDATNMEQAGTTKAWSCYLPLKGMGVEYLGNAGTVADIVTNGLFILAATSNTTYAPSLLYNARLRFRG